VAEPECISAENPADVLQISIDMQRLASEYLVYISRTPVDVHFGFGLKKLPEPCLSELSLAAGAKSAALQNWDLW